MAEATQTTQTGPKAPKLNALGFDRKVYEGAPSTLCMGCGHDSVTRALTTALFESGVPPHQVAKMSGIGCSSKTTAYFLSRAHGFNGVHGRMPAMATGVNVANRDLQVVGISGDGDTASIGIGQFLHAVRRNTDMVYVIDNNGVYGLTKGQFSATADQGAYAKKAGKNVYPTIDCCGLAIELGCGFVGRSYSGNAKQMQALFQAAMAYRGFALIDVISPCVTFNPDTEGATKTYQWAKEREIALNEVGYIPEADEAPAIDPKPGEVCEVELQDGSHMRIGRVEADYDPRSRMGAIARIDKAIRQSELITGLLFIDEKKQTLLETLDITGTPLARLSPEQLRPSKAAFDDLMKKMK